MTTNLEHEAERMRRIPGIIFADTPIGDRVARVAGTGLEVFEVILSYLATAKDFNQLREGFHWLSEEQLRSAVRYYETYPDEINAQIEENNTYTPEYVYSRYPFTKPKQR
jgi:uncharacterized protein (DUF433 family)